VQTMLCGFIIPIHPHAFTHVDTVFVLGSEEHMF
jgi:hypothetical protein